MKMILKNITITLLAGFLFAGAATTFAVSDVTGIPTTQEVNQNKADLQRQCATVTLDQCGKINPDCGIVNGKCVYKVTACESAYIIEACQAGPNCTWDTTSNQCASAAPAAPNVQNNTNFGKVIAPYQTKIEIPCDTTIAGGNCPAANNPANYVARLYQFGLMIVGFVALGAIIYGAALYTLSAGNVTSKEEGKEWMKSAIYGIVLLFGAYLILYTINPKLVSITNPTIEPIDLSTMLGKSIYVPTETTGNNSVSENAGQAIDGCEVQGSSSLVDFGVSLNVNGQEVAGASTGGTTKCTKCFPGNVVANDKCLCEPGKTRQETGYCCGPNEVSHINTTALPFLAQLANNPCLSCDKFTSMNINDRLTAAKELTQEQISRIQKYCGVSLTGIANNPANNYCASGFTFNKTSNQCVSCSSADTDLENNPAIKDRAAFIAIYPNAEKDCTAANLR